MCVACVVAWGIVRIPTGLTFDGIKAGSSVLVTPSGLYGLMWVLIQQKWYWGVTTSIPAVAMEVHKPLCVDNTRTQPKQRWSNAVMNPIFDD